MLRAMQGGGAAAQSQGESAPPDLGAMLMHHLEDGKTIEVEILGFHKEWPLPQWEPWHIGALELDLSPTKHVFFLVVAALLLLAVFVPIGRAMRSRYMDRAPSGLPNAMEALVVYFRDEVVRRNIGHGADAYTPYILTIFFFILAMNLVGLVPFGATPTERSSRASAAWQVSTIGTPWVSAAPPRRVAASSSCASAARTRGRCTCPRAAVPPE